MFVAQMPEGQALSLAAGQRGAHDLSRLQRFPEHPVQSCVRQAERSLADARCEFNQNRVISGNHRQLRVRDMTEHAIDGGPAHMFEGVQGRGLPQT
jgi:hypothetical protein